MSTPAPFTRSRAVAAALALSLALAACGGDTDDTDDTDAAAEADTDTDTETATDAGSTDDDVAAGDFPVTVDAENGEVTIESRPERIISLSPSATEILFAIGAGDRVIAADQFSTYPEDAPTTDLSGWDPNVEAIVGYEPDLVLIANDSNDLVASLEALDIPVLANSAPADIEGGYDIVAAMGMATGEIDGAASVVEEMRAGLEEALAAAPQDQQIRVYHELDDTFFSASSHSFIGSVYEQMGAVNIADEADADATGYPQLTEEAIVEADPQLIVITDQVTYTAEDVANRPGWSQIEAVRNGNIVTVDADIASRWGPRLPQLVELVADAMNSVAAPVGR
ncbi:ABC transporter substrate-binding protein [Ornithinimicrobium sufpigmenti]|uniref:ABC transporter substrate-binding protein n=1 Tax=Ornithinimicrobium sufpigmenti TaxID=2508882 RepID=UPI001036812D|nr:MULTISPECIES: ABC transporter substrate-binding protein [unclassified Ornithinimicrobium]